LHSPTSNQADVSLPALKMLVNSRVVNIVKSCKVSTMGKNIVLTLFFLLTYLVSLNAQSNLTDEIEVNHQIWFDFHPHFYINEKLEYYDDAGYRTILNEEIWHRIYVRPSLRYHINNL